MATAPPYGSRWPLYARMWDAMQRTRLTETQADAKRIMASKARYVTVEAKTSVPWYMIGCIHYRESDLDFSTQLAQGDPLNKVSTHVPDGMGPYFGPDAWERAALEALEHDGLTTVKDWRIEKIIYYWERYNGWGYYQHGIPSAYVWASSDQYHAGMYVADGQWSPNAVDRRSGCAPLLKTMIELDPTIAPERETAEPLPVPGIPTVTVTISAPKGVTIVVKQEVSP